VNHLDHALRYADQGMHVFFLGATKRPVANCPACQGDDSSHNRETCDCLTCHGFYAASVDPDRIRAMHNATPGGLLAIRTGAPSQVVVIDIDPGNGGDLLHLIGTHDVPRTAYVNTGSGGHHLYYRHPGTHLPNSAGRLGAGIDVRGDGGYVVAPPSLHPRTRRPYQWGNRMPAQEMPDTLVKACLPPPAPAPTFNSAPTATNRAGGITHPDRLLAAHLASVERAAPGTRRATLYGASRGVARMVAAGAIRIDDAVQALTDAGRHAQQTTRDTRRAIEDGFRAEGVRA